MNRITKTLLLAIAVFTVVNCSSSKTNSKNDGLSLENAMKVTSVDQEYEIMRKLCPGCKLNSQALAAKNGKHYDIISLTKPDGAEIKYYFNIDSFYGKW